MKFRKCPKEIMLASHDKYVRDQKSMWCISQCCKLKNRLLRGFDVTIVFLNHGMAVSFQ